MQSKSTSLRSYSIIFITFLLLPYLSLNALDKKKCTEKQLKNFISCIQSDNEGVRKSTIYLVGKYGIEGAADALEEALEKEENPAIILLITFALYQIDEQRATFAALDLAVTTSDEDLSKKLMQTVVGFAKK